MGKPVRFRKGDRVCPKRNSTTPIEEGLSSITGQPLLVVESCQGLQSKPTVTFNGIQGEYYARDFERVKPEASGKKRRSKPLRDKVLGFDGLSS